jgi:hypothetical protein
MEDLMTQAGQGTWERSPIWDSWGAVTQFLQITRMAFDAEIARWEGIYKIADQQQVVIARQGNGQQNFEVNLPIYLATLRNEHMLCALVLQYSYGLIEQHVRNMLAEAYQRGKITQRQIDPRNRATSMDDAIGRFIPSNRGIEKWGTSILKLLNRSWTDVSVGCEGLVEVAIVRNAIAHGVPVITPFLEARARRNNLQLRWAVGDTVDLNIALLEEYRARLRSFGRVLVSGLVN